MNPKKRKRALSLVELIITVAIFSLMTGLLSFVALQVGLKTRESITEIPSLEQSFRTMNFIRIQLLPADWESLEFADDNSSVEYENPLLGTTASLTFDGENRNLVYDPDITTDEDERTWSRNITGTFSPANNDSGVEPIDPNDNKRTVQIVITTEARNRLNQPISHTFIERMKVRN